MLKSRDGRAINWGGERPAIVEKCDYLYHRKQISENLGTINTCR